MNRKLNVKYWLILLIPASVIKRNNRPTKYSNPERQFDPKDIHDNTYFPGHGVDDVSIALAAPSLYIPNVIASRGRGIYKDR